jgi:hypothetical protein
MCLQGLKNRIVLAVSDRVVRFRVSQGPCAFLIVYGFLFAWILCNIVGTEAGDWGHIIWRLHQEHASSTSAQVLTVFPNPGSKTVDLKGHKLHTNCPLGPLRTVLWFWTILRFILQTFHFHEENNKAGPAKSRFDGYLAVRSWLGRLYVLLNLRLLGGGHSEVDPIVASFSGGAVGVITSLMVVELNNVKQQEHKRCKYCHGTGTSSSLLLALPCVVFLVG